jgi:hypothetical protein
MHENQPGDDFDSLYRRAFSGDVGRPSESVRRAVLRHAAELAANRAADLTATGRHADLGTKRAGANPRWRRSAVYGSLAAAALACLVVVPHWLLPPTAVRAPAPRTQDRQPGDVSAETSSDRQVDAVASYYDRPHAPRLPPRPARSSEGGASLAQESASRAMTATPAITAPAVSPPATASAIASAAPAAAPRDAASALREAAETGNVPRLRALLDEHPDVDARDLDGRTALMLAVMNGRPGAVAALLACGADPNAAAGNGTTPLQVAEARDEPDIAAALRRAGGR